jgi:deoxyribodipyrimidine photo-lyase
VTAPALVWFREDLRVSDNPALWAAVETGLPVLCFHVFESVDRRGSASRWWLHGALEALAEALQSRGIRLELFRGAALDLVPLITRETGASALFWNRRYGPEREIDAALKSRLRADNLTVKSFSSRLLFEPGEVTTKSGELYKVFTPYRNATLAKGPPPPPLRPPGEIRPGRWPEGLEAKAVALESLALEPRKPDWAKEMRAFWERGEAGAQKRLAAFLEKDLAGYAETRNRPDLETTSRLSPHLHFGEISPRQILYAARHALDSGDFGVKQADFDVLRSEIGWRDFSHQLLCSHENIALTNIQRNFDEFPWREDSAGVEAWKRGMTGYPLVDAGMRQLWSVGFMHNRVRMVAASFLIKHLLVDWRIGERWFWDTLVDADPANNAASWQWVAGSGADAAPYYRIFNPVAQGERFDPHGDYVRRWVPELARLPRNAIHRPWEASPAVLDSAGVRLGGDYPLPIVAHDAGRKRALAAFESMRRSASSTRSANRVEA